MRYESETDAWGAEEHEHSQTRRGDEQIMRDTLPDLGNAVALLQANRMSEIHDPLKNALELMQAGRAREAARQLEALCQVPPATAQDCFTQGVAQHILGRLDSALAAFDRAHEIDPSYVQALVARASILEALRRPNEALASYTEALALDPCNAQTLTNMGIVLEQLGRTEEALNRYRHALDVDPRCFPALLNRSALCMRLGRMQEALDATERLVALHPNAADAHFNRAEVLLALDCYQEVVAACDRVLAISPAHVGAQIDRAVALACLGWFEQSLRVFELARATDPVGFQRLTESVWKRGDVARANWPRGPGEPPDPRALYLARGAARLARCDWRERDDFLLRLHQIVRAGAERRMPVCEWSLPFCATWLPLADDVRLMLASAVGRQIDERTAAARLPAARARRRRDRRLRIGYLTPDVRDHPTVSLTAPLLEQHDRGRVTVYAYALNPRAEEQMAARFRRSCDCVRECHAKDDLAIARLIRDDAVDILVDLAGYTDFARPEVAALRPAPINCTYLGYPGTTGAAWMDYRIADPVAMPLAEQHLWSEKLALLPRTMFVYGEQDVAGSSPSRREAGLPEGGFVFCCFHTSNKIDPAVFAIWLRLLQRVPGSVLWLLSSGATDQNLRAQAAARGVDPRRLVFAPRVTRKDHLARQRLADLFLDTPKYNAHTTAVEALYVGLPVLTDPDQGPASRMGMSIVLAAGLHELVATGPIDYEQRAFALATEPARLQALKQKWQANRNTCPLFDPADLARAMENVFEAMWRRHAAGLAPDSFQLPAGN